MITGSVSTTELSNLISYLWNNDWNAAVDDVDYELDLQGKIYNYDDKKDLAPNEYEEVWLGRGAHSAEVYIAVITFQIFFSLFSQMHEYQVLEVPTYKTFYKLLDNYIATTGQVDSLTSSERNEVNNFLDEIMKTSIMKKTHDFLQKKGNTCNFNPFSFSFKGKAQ